MSTAKSISEYSVETQKAIYRGFIRASESTSFRIEMQLRLDRLNLAPSNESPSAMALVVE